MKEAGYNLLFAYFAIPVMRMLTKKNNTPRSV